MPRPVGTPNRVNSKIRTTIAALLDKKADKIEQWLDKIEEQEGPYAAYQALLAILEYGAPKMARIENVGDAGGPIEHNLTVEFVKRGDKAP